jgi:serine/threonine protein kinase
MADTPRPPAAAQVGSTKVLGRYRCEHRIAADQWLETWRARVQGLAGFDQLFALHCLTAGALARRPNAAEGMLRAARSTANIKDARVAAVHDSGLAPGTAFVARELVHGISLRDLELHLHGGEKGVGTAPPPLPPGFSGVLAHVAAEIAAALVVAHTPEPSFPHGALGPTAVMVTPQGAIKLIDLGLRASVLTPQEIAASPAHGPYAAPELARGELTTAADLYALGRVVAGLGGGGAPGRGADAIRALPGILQATVRRLLSDEPRQRPTARQAEEQLRLAARDARALDAQAELGRLVRVIMQLQASRPQSASEPDDGELARAAAVAVPAAPAPSELFADEPTAILGLSGDGSSPLASLLRELRGHDEDVEEEGTDRSGIPVGVRSSSEQVSAHHAPTPLQGVPVVTGPPGYESFEPASPTVMTSAVNLPIPPPSPRQVRTPAMGIGGTPSPVPATASGPAPRIIQVLPTPRSTPSRPMKAQGSGPAVVAVAAVAPAPTAVPVPTPRPASTPPPPPTPAPLLEAAAAPALPAPVSPRDSSTGTPVDELKDLTTDEISASFAAGPLERPTKDMKAEGVPEPVNFRGFSVAVTAKSGEMTPASWRPQGNLEESPLAGERPGSLGGIEIPTRRRPRHMVTLAVGGVAGLAVLVVAGLLIGRASAPRASAPRPAVTEASASGAPAPSSMAMASSAGPASGPAPAPAARPAAAGQAKVLEPRAAVVEASREIEVHSSPPGATVMVAGQARGITPLRLYISSDAPDLKLVRSGYESRVVPLGPTTGKLIEASLTPLENDKASSASAP